MIFRVGGWVAGGGGTTGGDGKEVERGDGIGLEDVKITKVEGSRKKMNRKRERDRDIERREAEAETQQHNSRVQVPVGTAPEDRAPAEKRGRQLRGSEDVEGGTEIKGLARPEKATPDTKILDEGPVALPGSLSPPPLQAFSLLPSSSLGGRRQRKGRGFGWDTPPNKRHLTAGEMEEEKEEGAVVKGEYVYSI
uniref:Uncharacterized protein n=1 Tax=Chromera velia CCMP2878 TaxID=1169474 RepID=A0A0G4GDK5_9ALVE|eukprot:Cvel_618.t1-p1 / transcript=Cvel_618.t1 / gene=Cvel_618 / organism=Chromera_velia_CCMP2878 / gene_product=hypothetical protein / transcript_product=hypothetical protein / location=Cvel_scaffold19:42230-44849(-) / protein_length=193 / sequence_SO=supercontig / SO=protein_coding / is_pseudo=false